MPDSVYLLIVILALALFAAVWVYNGWAEFDERRRRERRVKLNLQRMAGGR